MTQEPSRVFPPYRSERSLRVVLAGGTGHVGAVLQRHFSDQGHSVIVLSRRPSPVIGKLVLWDGATLGPWIEAIESTDVLINLCGRSVNCRFTAANRREVMDSRVRPTQLLGEAVQQLKNPPRIWLNASTATIYRHSLDRDMDEVSGELGGREPEVPRSWDFSVEVGKRWEEAFFAASAPATRKIALRSAVVMSPDRQSIFDVLLSLVRFGLGGTVGGGKQYVSWIHEADFVRAIEHIIASPHLSHVVNLSSPYPIPNAEFMRVLRAAWGTQIGLPAPRPILEIGTFLMRTESELVLKSRRVTPRRLLEDGFRFHFTSWPEAAKELVQRWRCDGRAHQEQEFWSTKQKESMHGRAN